MKIFLLPLCLLLANCGQAPSPILSAKGLGQISFGMQLADAERTMGARRNPGKLMAPECDYVEFGALPGARFMVENGRITRAEVQPTVANTLGIEVGARLSEIQRTHPEARVQLHKYDPDSHYIIFEGQDPKYAIVMEEGNGVVTKIRAGIQPSVAYVEGCL